MNDLRNLRLALVDEISALEVLGAWAVDEEHTNRAAYCNRRVASLTDRLAHVNREIAFRAQDAIDSVEDDRVLRADIEGRR